MTVTADLAALLVSQHGVVDIDQLRGLGLTEQRVRGRVRRGEFVRVYRGVFRQCSVRPTWMQRAFAALLAAGPDSALSGRSAAVAHGLEGISDDNQVSVTVPAKRCVTPRGLVVHRTRERLPVTLVQGLRVTSLARTFVDLAAEVTDEALELALDHAQRRRRGMLDWLDWYVAQLNKPARPGVARLMRLVELRRDGGTDSVLEVKVWRTLREQGFTNVARQHVVTDAEGPVMRVDFAWPVLKVALHVDGYAFHSGKAQMQRDADQRSRLELLGWRQQVVMHGTLSDGRWVTQLRRKLEQAAVPAPVDAPARGVPSAPEQLALFITDRQVTAPGTSRHSGAEDSH